MKTLADDCDLRISGYLTAMYFILRVAMGVLSKCFRQDCAKNLNNLYQIPIEFTHSTFIDAASSGSVYVKT